MLMILIVLLIFSKRSPRIKIMIKSMSMNAETFSPQS
jgi:hypothetical protein